MSTDEEAEPKYSKLQAALSSNEPYPQSVVTSGVAVVKPVMLVSNIHTPARAISAESGGPTVTPKIIPPRRQREFIPEERKDLKYWDKRRRNNEAAKRSREKRRFHDMKTEQQITKLSQENDSLRKELAALKQKFGVPDDTSFSDENSSMKVDSDSQGESANSNTNPPVSGQQVSEEPPTKKIKVEPPDDFLHDSRDSTTSSVITRSPAVSKHVAATGITTHSIKTSMSTTTTPPENSISAALRAAGACTPEKVNTNHAAVNSFPQFMGSKTSLPHMQLPLIPAHLNSAMFPHNMNASAFNTLLMHSGLAPNVLPMVNNFRVIPPAITKLSERKNAPDGLHALAEVAVSESPLNLTCVPKKPSESKTPSTAGSSSVPPTHQGKPDMPGTAEDVEGQNRLVIAEDVNTYTSDSDSEAASHTSDSETAYGAGNSRYLIDPKYAERRRRNNEAARKCRENRKALIQQRKAKTDHLENENKTLRTELQGLAEEIAVLRGMIEKKRSSGGKSENGSTEENTDSK
ncbi:uncharacterized protein LOC106165643 isoform X2 [Lingula anatina]|nr:uncharacterized protein LOC106165643 isoform X2 [Lingula anatina]XP_013399393.1 uncharacterized protein LOC106165643 isoform X2 [Lingula anatina]XP_013399394.1 uncharacterized protein LOC106165643 isoform X2 [Lingula anatina]XP_013399395.1 uncharacterized protein LOC106165643 isoform X2 [Lingula anatina]XP_013399396.1 uncharacterized protein LOC106165643 isoform X2 [Lingula anatina]XP_013399397.1 uncharacterized protein LOC106165643 isoform X2 [Lingula anatina]XP_013399398.1 uncharacterize|eukprot:XP_013399392.1 uncharacterized protein LOC106165643 isoform X2 [Lingula anatina]